MGISNFSKETKFLIIFIFIFSLTNLLIFVLAMRFSLNTLLSHVTSKTAKLEVLSQEFKKEIQLYKEIRNTNDIKLFRQIIALRSELANLLNKEEKTLGASSSAISSPKISSSLLGILKIKENRWEKIEVFAEPRASSKIIGEISISEPIVIYFYSQKLPGWFRIEYQEGKWGWIQEQFVEELYD